MKNMVTPAPVILIQPQLWIVSELIDQHIKYSGLSQQRVSIYRTVLSLK